MSASSAVNVHRLRFGDWMPSPIKAIAPDPFSSMVAIGREDGDIEIADSSGYKWYTNARIPGRTDFDLRSLVWSPVEAEKGRLFGISLRGFLFEVDLAALSFRQVQESYGGAIWSISANPNEAKLAVGCEDGSIRIFSYSGGGLEYDRAFFGTTRRVLSVAYHPAKEQLFCGSSDGTISCLDATTGRSIYTMVGDLMKGAVTLIWSLLVLSDSTVVSGDNRGHVQFWDGITGVLMVSFHQHTAEILALAASTDETQVFASGVDSRVTCVRRIRTRSSSFVEADEARQGVYEQNVDNHWVYTASHRPHSHNVYALAVCQHSRFFSERKKGGGNETDRSKSQLWTAQPLLISGGQDTKLCTYSINDFVDRRPVWILPIPASGLVSKSADYSRVGIKHRNHIDVWAVNLPGIQQNIDVNKKNTNGKKYRKVDPEGEYAVMGDSSGVDRCILALRLELKSSEHIHSFSLSPNGKYLAVSGHFGFRLWCIVNGENRKQPLTCHPVEVPELQPLFCHNMCFSTDGTRLALCTDKGRIHIVDIVAEDQISIRDTIDHYRYAQERRRDSMGAMDSDLLLAVNHVALSSDGLYLAVSDCTENVYVYELDRVRLYWKLPACGGTITSVAFPPIGASTLFILLAENILMYDLEAMKLTRWCDENTHRISKILVHTQIPLHGVTFHPTESGRLFVHGQSICMNVDTKKSIPKKVKVMTPFLGDAFEANESAEESDGGSPQKKSKKRRVSTEQGPSNFSAVYAYRSVIDLTYLENHLVVLENPWVRILDNLPDTLARKRYGT